MLTLGDWVLCLSKMHNLETIKEQVEHKAEKKWDICFAQSLNDELVDMHHNFVWMIFTWIIIIKNIKTFNIRMVIAIVFICQLVTSSVR